MRPMLMIPLVIAVMLAVVLAGCQQPAEMSGTEQPADGVQQVDVVLDEWQVTLTPDTVDAGEVSFVIRNEGNTIHALEIEDAGIEERSVDLQPGESTTMTVDLPAGEYRAYCPIGNHDDRGMTTQLTVRER